MRRSLIDSKAAIQTHGQGRCCWSPERCVAAAAAAAASPEGNSRRKGSCLCCGRTGTIPPTAASKAAKPLRRAMLPPRMQMWALEGLCLVETSKRPKLSVHFAEDPTVVLGFADPDYDRRSIKVDLTRTPYALFHKDYYLMNRPAEYSPKHTGKEGRSSSLSDDEEELHTEGEGSSSDDEARAEEVVRQKRMISLERRRALRPNFSGIWKRSRIEGFIELLAFSGVPRKAALAAAQKRPVHIIDHDDDYFRLIIKNGLVKSDAHYIIGDEPRIEKSGATDYEVVLDWGHGTANGRAESLVLTSISVNAKAGGSDSSGGSGGGGSGGGSSGGGGIGGSGGGAAAIEMIAVRTLEDGGDVLVLQQIVRKPATGEEARARHIFKRVIARSSGALSAAKPRTPRGGKPAVAVAAAVAAAAEAAAACDSGTEGAECEAAAAAAAVAVATQMKPAFFAAPAAAAEVEAEAPAAQDAAAAASQGEEQDAAAAAAASAAAAAIACGGSGEAGTCDTAAAAQAAPVAALSEVLAQLKCGESAVAAPAAGGGKAGAPMQAVSASQA